ncbi:bifunctional coenzyme A synthase [Macrosteles quadrilineatus]|uniref:bifunctional coenzyme A synthase n=1 Tax=Macrosteles quadrilineatus TaxID=74068 RepID=UPI0023E09598|nr:bifunctional coenzyme A synthase [Macrosteles quadrilineatus]
MMKTGMLIISHPNAVYRNLPKLISEINNILYIQYFPLDRWNKNITFKSVNSGNIKPNWPNYSSLVIGLYSKVLSYKHLDVRILLSGTKLKEKEKVITKKPIDFVCYDETFRKDDVNNYVSSFVQNKVADCQIVALSNDNSCEVGLNDNCIAEVENIPCNIYDNVVLGGTFDRLHYGHKILLSEAILRCRKKITVGVTDTPMLKSKKLWELVEPCELRIQKVKDFLEEVDPSIEYDVVPISDIYGPTKDDPTFQMIVVSSETTRGGSAVNQVREANGLNTLCIHEVGLLVDPNKEDEVEEDKISSSNLRLRCLGTLLRPPQPNPAIPESPYIVGLTGGIASGKTNIADYLATLGAGVVSCDKLGHEIYSVGKPGHTQVVEVFGDGVLDASGAIDRKKLGAIVFSNKEKLQVLNQLLWPLILQEAQQSVKQLYSQGHKVVILEAAVLISAGWQTHCHELWTSIVPPDEAVKRVMERNGLTEQEARARVEAQPKNTEYVELANVVLSSQWRVEYTRKQVDKAWTGLLTRLGLHT